MTDRLKQFIDNNREEFDTELPGQGVLNNMKKKWNPATSKNWYWHPLRWAAFVTGLLLISATIYLVSRGDKKKPVEVVKQAPVIEEVNGISDPIYAKQIETFRTMIGLKQEELKQLKREYPELYEQFVDDITELDSSYQSLKLNLSNNPNREMLLEAMIQNLQLQSELLNRQLLIIKEIKQKSKNHEKNII